MNYVRSLSVVITSIAFTICHVTDFGIILVFLLLITMPIAFIALYSICKSLIKKLCKEKEHISVRIANYIMLGCICVCILYSSAWLIYTKLNYNIVASFFEKDGPHSCYIYKLFSKDGRVKGCVSTSNHLTLPIHEEGFYKQVGDTLICEKDTFIIDQEKGILIDKTNDLDYIIE